MYLLLYTYILFLGLFFGKWDLDGVIAHALEGRRVLVRSFWGVIHCRNHHVDCTQTFTQRNSELQKPQKQNLNLNLNPNLRVRRVEFSYASSTVAFASCELSV